MPSVTRSAIGLLFGLTIITSLVPLLSQIPAPSASSVSQAAQLDETVATIEGEKFTPRKIQQLRDRVPGQFRQAFSHMDNKEFLKTYAQLMVLSRLAEREEILENEPVKTEFAFWRMNFLAQAYGDYISKRIKLTQEDYVKYYNEHEADYDEATVRVIYIAFSPNAAAKASSGDPSGKKRLTEEEAKAKAEALWAQLKNGADFGTLAKDNSDSKVSAERGGDIGRVKKGAAGTSAELRQVIFGLKPGEISKPVRQSSGYYILKVDNRRTVPFEEASGEIAATLQNLKVKEELDRITNSIRISYENEAYFNQKVIRSAPKLTVQ